MVESGPKWSHRQWIAKEGLEENMRTGGWFRVLQAFLQILGSYIGLLLGNDGSEDVAVTNKLVRLWRNHVTR